MSLAYDISARNRHRKWRLFMETFAPTRDMRILDVGYSEREYADTDNYIEKHYPFPEMLTALGIDDPVTFTSRYPMVNVVRYGGEVFPFEDASFDIAWSNAVIEHVGDRDRQILFLKELKRVARRVFITTPNRYFPVELHTRLPLLHYLPKKLFDAILPFTGKAWAAGNYMHLMSHGELIRMLGEAGITEYRIHRNRFCGFTMDMVVLF